jgi:hypothetical protein
MELLHLLAEAREETGLPVVTEVMEPDLVETVSRYADVLQIGSRNIHNFPLLRAVGQNSNARPVLLKRGLAATIEEWLLAAEYIVVAGNPQVILGRRCPLPVSTWMAYQSGERSKGLPACRINSIPSWSNSLVGVVHTPVSLPGMQRSCCFTLRSVRGSNHRRMR